MKPIGDMAHRAILRCHVLLLPPPSVGGERHSLLLWRAVGRMSDYGRPVQQADFHGVAEIARIIVPLTRLAIDAGSPHISPEESDRAPQARASRTHKCPLALRGCGVKVGLQGRQRGEAILCCASSIFPRRTPTTTHLQTLRTAVGVVVRTGYRTRLTRSDAHRSNDMECRPFSSYFISAFPN